MAVTFIIEFKTNKSSFPPKYLIIIFLCHGIYLPTGIPKKGASAITAAMFKNGQSIRIEVTTRPPIECPNRIRGLAILASSITATTHFSISCMVVFSLPTPDNPNPFRSTINTSNSFFRKCSATLIKSPECSPNPWTIKIVVCGTTFFGMILLAQILVSATVRQKLFTVRVSVSLTPISEEIIQQGLSIYYYLNRLRDRSQFKISLSFKLMLTYFSKNKIQSRIPYESNDFLFRWKKIERVVAKESVDGLLIVAGPDSNNNLATTQLLNWLFLGHSGDLIATNSYLPNTFHELIVFISKNSMIFLPPNARKQLNSYVYAIPTMEVFSPTQEEFENGETFSVLKISEFHRIVRDHKKIGVLGGPKQIQKWPLIQSFALEQIGGTFFTLKFQVQNITQKVEAIYKNHDKHSLKTLTQITSKRMHGYLVGTTSVIQNTPLSQRSDLTEIQLNQPINQAIEIQQLQFLANSPTTEQPKRASSVLIGLRTNQFTNFSSETKISKSLHFTVDYSDPNTRLRVCRTYFLSSGAKIFQQLIEESIPQENTFLVDKAYTIQRKVNSQYKNQHILATLYSNLVEATLESIVGITKDYRNLNSEYIKSTIVTRLSKILRDIYSFFPLINIDAELFSYNSLGQPQKIDFKDIISFKLTPHYHIIKTSIRDIPSHDDQKNILGGIIFSQSFVLQEGCYMLFTNTIPYFDIFDCHSGASVEIYDKLNPSIRFQQLGNTIEKAITDCRLFVQVFPKQETKLSPIPVFNITIHFHQNALRLYSDKLGWLLIPYDYIKEPTVLNSISGYWVQLSLIDNLILGDYSSNQIILGLAPKAQQLFLKRLGELKESLPLTETNQLPLHLSQNDYFMKSVMKQKDQGLITNSQVLSSEFLFNYLESKQLMILNSMKDLKLSAFRLIYNKPDASLDQKELSKPHVILVNGTYGSGKNRFANNLLRYARENRFPTSAVFTVSHQNLRNKLELSVFVSMLEEFIADQPKRGAAVTLVVVPCWINSKELLESVSQKLHIRCVCTKINVANFYSTQNFQLTQNTLTYCTSGFSQFVFLDTFGQDQKDLNEITNIVWGYCPESKVISIENNSVSSGVARDIFSMDKYMRQSQVFLRGKYGVLYELKQDSELRFVEIRYPLKLQETIKKLRAQDGYLYSSKILERELQNERLEAEGSKDELLITLFKIKQKITTSRRKGLSMRLKWLKGNLRLLDQKQIQEITWTSLFYRQKQNKGATILGLSVLFNKWNEHQFQELIDEMSEKSEFTKKLKQPITAQSITPQEIKALQLQNRDKYLENGEFFDGTFYRDCEGTILKSHPKLPLLIKEYMELQNASRDDQNSLVRGQWEIYKNSFKK